LPPLSAGFFFVLLVDPEDRDDKFLRIVRICEIEVDVKSKKILITKSGM
jgi:hypothetical protein